MSTVSPPRKHVKVVALLSGNRERVLLDEPLTKHLEPIVEAKQFLALGRPVHPLVSMLLDGAGLPYRPKGIKVYVDGKLVWQAKCNRHGATDALSATHPTGPAIHCVPFTDAFGQDYTDERLADNRAAWEYLRNDPDEAHWADDVAADLVDEVGSLRPKLRPSKPAPLPVYREVSTQG